MKNNKKTIKTEEFLTQINAILNTAKEKLENLANDYVKCFLLDKGFSQSVVDYFETSFYDGLGHYDSIDSSYFNILFDGVDIDLILQAFLQLDRNQIIDYILKNYSENIDEYTISLLKRQRKY